jgi:hypothetical protein
VCQHLAALTEREIVNKAEFEIMSNVKLSDGFLQPAILLVRSNAASAASAAIVQIATDVVTPIAVRVRYQLREDI